MSRQLVPSKPIVLTGGAVPPPVPGLPDPVPFPGSKIIDASGNGHWARIRHDGDWTLYPAPRIPGSNNNEVQVFRQLKSDGSKVDPQSKITMKIGGSLLLRVQSDFKAQAQKVMGVDVALPIELRWEQYCESFMTPWAWKRFTARGYWCYDTGYPTFNLLGAGGNDVHVLDITSDNWARVEHQDYHAGPNYAINPNEHRWLFSKQWLVGGQIGDAHWVVDKGYVGGVGDVNIGLISPVEVYLSTWVPENGSRSGQQGLEFWPDLPLAGKLHGVDVTVTKYGLWKTNTFGFVEGSGWHLLEEMVVSGDPDDRAVGGNWQDRRVYFEPWLKSHPPTYIGWTRES